MSNKQFIAGYGVEFRLGIPQPTKRQRIGNEINAAFIFARANRVTCCWLGIVFGSQLALKAI